jgi:hypothetical protein
MCDYPSFEVYLDNSLDITVDKISVDIAISGKRGLIRSVFTTSVLFAFIFPEDFSSFCLS